MLRTKTYSPKAAEVKMGWFIIDAASLPLGRLASETAKYLMGRHKINFSHHIDMGDNVIIVNAAELKLTGRKLEQKKYYRHSGYPGNLKTATAKEIIAKNPTTVIETAVKGMLPKNKLQAGRLKRLYIYKTDEHPHGAQKPQSPGESSG